MTIKPNELRIGNWVSDGTNNYQIIHGWQIDEGMEVFGIPLTHDWLERFGFLQNPDWELKWGDHHKFNINDEMHLHICHGRDAVRMAYNVNTVHRLQNIYLDLTQTEL